MDIQILTLAPSPSCSFYFISLSLSVITGKVTSLTLGSRGSVTVEVSLIKAYKTGRLDINRSRPAVSVTLTSTCKRCPGLRKGRMTKTRAWIQILKLTYLYVFSFFRLSRALSHRHTHTFVFNCVWSVLFLYCNSQVKPSQPHWQRDLCQVDFLIDLSDRLSFLGWNYVLMGKVDSQGNGQLTPSSFALLYRPIHDKALANLARKPCWHHNPFHQSQSGNPASVSENQWYSTL